jgi:hypothetical protein
VRIVNPEFLKKIEGYCVLYKKNLAEKLLAESWHLSKNGKNLFEKTVEMCEHNYCKFHAPSHHE